MLHGCLLCFESFSHIINYLARPGLQEAEWKTIDPPEGLVIGPNDIYVHYESWEKIKQKVGIIDGN